MQQVPGVIPAIAVQFGQRRMIEVFRKYAIASVSPERSAILHGPKCLPFGASAARDQAATRVRGFFGDNVNYSVNSIRCPKRCPRAPNHFDPLDVLKRYVLRI